MSWFMLHATLLRAVRKFVLMALIISSLLAISPESPSAAESGHDTFSKVEFEKRVRDYLLANPEVILEALQALEARRMAEEQSDGARMIAQNSAALFQSPDSPVAGNVTGNVTIVEFFDYNCPYCRSVAQTLNRVIESDGYIRVVFKEFPILGPNSVFAARVALAANAQGRYADFHDRLMSLKGQADEASVFRAASELGLDLKKLEADMKDPLIDAEIRRNEVLAKSLRINGTPAFVIGNEVVRGAADLDTIMTLVQRARNKR